MKKAILLIMLCCLGTTAAMAQTINKKDLVGTWKAHLYEDENAGIDLVTGKINYASDLKDVYSDDEIYEVEVACETMSQMYTGAKLIFEESLIVKIIMEGEQEDAIYSVVERDGKSFLTVIDEDFSQTYIVAIVGKTLHLIIDENAELVFKK